VALALPQCERLFICGPASSFYAAREIAGVILPL